MGAQFCQGTEYYDGKLKRYVDFPITDILQMMGRAGRPQYDQYGKAVILVHEPKKGFYKKFLYEPFPVESSLHEHIHDHINAEIVSGTISCREDAVHYLTWTYLYRRLMVNPAYYGIKSSESDGLSSFVSRLVQNTLDDLEDSGCVEINEENVVPTMLGSVASQYYLDYMTVSLFASNIERDTTLEVFLHILCASSEYDELPVRHNEENYNADLCEKIRIPVDKNLLDDPHVKTNLLFQAHFSRLELPITDYITDLKSVLDQSIRIIQAMIDICANSGWFSSAITCMHLMQMTIQGVWYGPDSSLLMLPFMTSDLLDSLNKQGVSNLQQILNSSMDSLQSMLHGVPAAQLYEYLQHFPCIKMVVKFQRNDASEGSSSVVNIVLEDTNTRHKGPKAFSPLFPKMKDEAWWLVLGDTNTSELYILKRVSIRRRLVTNMKLPSVHSGIQGMKVMLVSDCYVGFQQEFALY